MIGYLKKKCCPLFFKTPALSFPPSSFKSTEIFGWIFPNGFNVVAVNSNLPVLFFLS